MQRRMALTIATAALSVPLLAVGGLALAADHARPDQPATSQVSDDTAGTGPADAPGRFGGPKPAATADRTPDGDDDGDDYADDADDSAATPEADDSGATPEADDGGEYADDHGCDAADGSQSGSGCTPYPHHDD